MSTRAGSAAGWRPVTATGWRPISTARSSYWTRLAGSRRALSVGLVGNIAEVLPALVRRGLVPDVVTDQTSAHDLRLGYIPAGCSLDQAAALRERDPAGYESRVLDSMVTHVARCSS